MAELAALLTNEIPEGRNNLSDSHVNLERVADYCETNYLQSDNKRMALEETKNYTTQSLASVAYQINTLAYNFLQLLDLQATQLSEMESQMNHISQTVMIHKEKVARREIGVLTANKTINRQYKIIAPANPEKPIKYVRRQIDYNILDEIGHGVRSATPRLRQRGTSQSSIQSLNSSGGAPGAIVGPAPTTKPPTPPAAVRGTGTLSKNSRDYRAPPIVAPPQVPSHYAPNYPMGHVRRERGPGYSTLPMPQAGHHTLPHQTSGSPQIGMVHPIPQLTQVTPPMPISSVMSTSLNSNDLNMPPPPSPLTLNSSNLSSAGDYSDHNSSGNSSVIGGQQIYRSGSMHHNIPLNAAVASQLHHTMQHRQGSCSPPLPPPPTIEDEHARFGQPAGSQSHPIMSDELDLPGWVPKNYIEKVVAIYDYYADKEDELSFQENAVIYVLKKNDDGWWEGVMDGLTGLFPGNYVEPYVSIFVQMSQFSSSCPNFRLVVSFFVQMSQLSSIHFQIFLKFLHIQLSDQEEAARKYLDYANKLYGTKTEETQYSEWAYATNITNETLTKKLSHFSASCLNFRRDVETFFQMSQFSAGCSNFRLGV
ncbi:hypothetical protein V9T40_004453 [Parthenolecanium corni]|uniref:Abl interactor 2 n=1 Tax=Parthenolecanium corni TaxID=536013 RepID=A0AAN9TWL5_9HEMI